MARAGRPYPLEFQALEANEAKSRLPGFKQSSSILCRERLGKHSLYMTQIRFGSKKLIVWANQYVCVVLKSISQDYSQAERETTRLGDCHVCCSALGNSGFFCWLNLTSFFQVTHCINQNDSNWILQPYARSLMWAAQYEPPSTFENPLDIFWAPSNQTNTKKGLL